MTHPANPRLQRPVGNIPDKPVLSDLFRDHLASLEHAHADKNVGEGALWSRPAITSIPVPVEIAMRQGATSGSADEGTLVSSGWRNGE